MDSSVSSSYAASGTMHPAYEEDVYAGDHGLVPDEWEINYEEITVERELGTGSFGKGIASPLRKPLCQFSARLEFSVVNEFVASAHSWSQLIRRHCSSEGQLLWNPSCNQAVTEPRRQNDQEVHSARISCIQVSNVLV